MEACSEEWKEWTSLRQLTELIPSQYQYGLNVAPLNLTCLDAFHDHLVIGTNAGLVYLAHLPSFNLIKLKCENVSSPIQSVASVSSVDDMIAAGCRAGIITVFQIPPPSSERLTCSQGGNVFEENTAKSCTPQRFTLGIHQAPVTALVWSKNGMRLFSGDTEGNVCLTEVDYEQQQCCGKSLVKVDSRIVQLAYAHQKLAISYEERCLIYCLKTHTQMPVGKKPRNPPGLFGCTIALSSDSPQEDILYCARPGQKIWSANAEGEVLFSYIHKKSHQNSTIKLLNVPRLPQRVSKFSFGYLYHYKGSILVSYSGNCLVLLNVCSRKVLGYCEDFISIRDVAICDDYVFVLDGHRNILCISPFKPSFGCKQKAQFLTTSLHIPSQENLTTTALSEIKNKMILPNKNLIDGIAKLGESVALKLSEMATPSIISGDKHSPIECIGNTSEGNSQHPLQESSEDGAGCDTVKKGVSDTDRYGSVVVPSRAKKKNKKKIEVSPVSVDDSKEEGEVGVFIHDSRTYEDFKEAIEEKESLLADALDLNCLKMDHERTTQRDSIPTASVSSSDRFNPDPPTFVWDDKGKTFHTPMSGYLSEVPNFELRSLGKPQVRSLAYGPPSGSSAANSSLEYQSSNLPSLTESAPHVDQSKERGLVSVASSGGLTFEEIDTTTPVEDFAWGWQKHQLPSNPEGGFLGCDNSIIFTDGRDLYFSHDFSPDSQKVLPSWTRKRLLLEIDSFCSFGYNILALTKQGHHLSLEIDKLLSPDSLRGLSLLENGDVVCAASDENVLWTLNKAGKVVARFSSEGSEKEVEISCQELRIAYLICRSGVVWGLTTSGRIAYRIGVRAVVPAGIEWGIMLHPQKVECIHLGDRGLGWMMDSQGDLYVSSCISQSFPQGLDGKWWQVGMSEYMLPEPDQRLTTDDGLQQGLQITSNEHYLWISLKNFPYAFTHSLKSLIGHRWDQLGTTRFDAISGEGIFKSFGTLYCTTAAGDLFAVSPHEDSAVAMDLPGKEKLSSVSCRPETLWAVTRTGKTYIRTGLTGSSSLGSKWARLDLQQIADVHLKHISLSTEVVWAVDTKGQVYVRQGPLTPRNPRKRGLDPTWIRVDSNELKNGAVFEKVFVGNKSHLVWGIDTNHRIYVREAIYPEFCTGTSWVEVPGILAQSLSISEDSVYVVTPSLVDSEVKTFGGQLFERIGISPVNYIGDEWKRIPSHSILFHDITTSVDNCLWALDNEGRVFKYSWMSISEDAATEHQRDDEGGFSSSDLEEWEIV